jgi:hypothetical protein
VNVKDLRRQRELLVELLNLSRAQRRARGVKKGKLELYDELGFVEHLLSLEDTSFSPFANEDRNSTAREQQ